MQAARLPRLGRAVRMDAALVQAVRDQASGHGELLMHAQRAWASNTFSGARHQLALAFDGDDAVAGAEHLIEALSDVARWKIPGQLLAAAAITTLDQRVDPPRLAMEVELLLLEEA